MGILGGVAEERLEIADERRLKVMLYVVCRVVHVIGGRSQLGDHVALP